MPTLQNKDLDTVSVSDFSQTFWRDAAVGVDGLDPLDEDSEIGDGEFRLLADALPTLCWIARGDGYIVWYNRRFYEYTGTSAPEMRGWGWQSVHDQKRLPLVLARWNASIAGGLPFEMTFPLRGSDGRMRPFLTRIVPIRDKAGTVMRWFGVNTEVGAQARAEAALSASEARYAVLTEAMPQMVWSTLPDGYHDYYNDRWYDFTGVPHGSTDGEAWNGMFHPDDQPIAWERWNHSLITGEPYEIEYRLRHHSGEYRWTLGRAQPVRDEDGAIIRWIGTCTDIHDAKMVAEQNEVLSRELSHRIKNIFAVIASLIGLSSRQEPDAQPYAKRLVDRIIALGRAHEFARPHSDRSRPDAHRSTLSAMLCDLMQPYQIDGADRVAIMGDEVMVDDQSATPIALIFHELATNATKYGALANDKGRVTIAIRNGDNAVHIDWRERGGPVVAGPPDTTGFGTQLAEMSVVHQLGGRVSRDWVPHGLEVSLSIPIDRLTRFGADQSAAK